MDPDVCLQELLELAEAIVGTADGNCQMDDEDLASAGTELAEKIQHLDGWLSKGGFLPRRWER